MAKPLLTDKELEGSKPLLTDADLEGSMPVAPKSKYPQPKSMSQSDADLGLTTGAIKSARIPGTALSTPLRPDMSQLEFDNRANQLGNDANRVESTLGGAAIGGIGGAVAKGMLAAEAAPSAATGVNALSAFAKSGKLSMADRISKAIGNTEGGLVTRGLQLLLPGAAGLAAKTVNAASRAAVATAPATGAAVGGTGSAIATAPSEDEPKPFRGVMSNAIDRLRAQPASNIRAQELLSRIEGLQVGAGTGEVTQATQGSP